MALQDAKYGNAELKSFEVQDVRNTTFIEYAARDYSILPCIRTVFIL